MLIKTKYHTGKCMYVCVCVCMHVCVCVCLFYMLTLDHENFKYSFYIRYVQYDSWWYHKAADQGVTEWTSLTKVFPQGLK